ncbi:MAG: hypothetical protein OXI96_08060 [Acidimicrobiaceae bacterium]|nr:hypothetical protein [Acidimicrobiaceae bacterium]
MADDGAYIPRVVDAQIGDKLRIFYAFKQVENKRGTAERVSTGWVGRPCSRVCSIAV